MSNKPNNSGEYRNKAEELFCQGYACSQAVLLAFADQFGLDDDTAKRLSASFGGGMGRLRKTCGALTGAFMVLGLKYGNTDPKDMDTKLDCYDKVRELTRQFQARHDTSECRELIKKYTTEKGIHAREHHKLICHCLVADVYDMLREM